MKNEPSKEEPSTSHSKEQEGYGGPDADFISKIASLVKDQLSKERLQESETNIRPIVANEQFYRLPLVSSSVMPENTTPPVPFDTQIAQNDLNDCFDHKHLLRRVPKKFQTKARNLLNAIDERPNELTWDSSGK